jgi:MFS family permease
MRAPRAIALLAALAAGLALADTSIVTLALPELLLELNTTVEGVAAVLGVYVLVLACATVPAARLLPRLGPRTLGAAGATVFGLASLACGLVGDLAPLLVARGVQALGGAGVLVAAFVVLTGGRDRPGRLWLIAAVLSAAVGPAVGGLLTELFSWRAIFLVQVPVAAGGLVAFLAASAAPLPAGPIGRFAPRPAAALVLVSAALSAVLFLLVLLLVAGWAVAPLAAAAAVTVVPAGALLGSRIEGDPAVRASAGAALVGGGVLALGFLPDASLWWTVAPQAAAGIGMGLALRALGGELLPERTPGEAAVLLTLRHVGIALVLATLAPVVAADYDRATERARERGVALVLDARLPPLAKLDLAPALLGGVDTDRPRATLRDALDDQRGSFQDPAEAAAFATMADRADATLISAVGEAFRTAFLVTGALALVGALVVLPVARLTAPAAALCVAALLAAAYALTQDARRPAAVTIADPCAQRRLPDTGGLSGQLQDAALERLDAQACKLGSSREELVLALADPADAARFEQRYGRNPRSLGSLLETLLGG